jgi:hypothetical protein
MIMYNLGLMFSQNNDSKAIDYPSKYIGLLNGENKSSKLVNAISMSIPPIKTPFSETYLFRISP